MFVRMLTLPLFMMAAIGLVAPAAADWQYTKWGDSSTQVLTHTDKGVRTATAAETKDNSIAVVGEALAVAPYKTPDAAPVAWFYFRKDRLVGVRLVFKTLDEAMAIQNRLNSQYGVSPNASDQMKADCRDIKSDWMDRERGNMVSYNAHFCTFGDFRASLMYKPVLTPAETGL